MSDRESARAEAITRCASRARALGYSAHEATIMAIGFADGWDQSVADATQRLADAGVTATASGAGGDAVTESGTRKVLAFIDDLYGGRRADVVTALINALVVGTLCGTVIPRVVHNSALQVLMWLLVLGISCAVTVVLGRRRRHRDRPSSPPAIGNNP